MILMLEDRSDYERYRDEFKKYKYPKDLYTVLSVIAQDERVELLPVNKIYAILSSCEKWLKHVETKGKKKSYKKYYYPTLKAIAENPEYQPYTNDIKRKLQNAVYMEFDYKEEPEETPWDETNMDYLNQELLNKYQTD